MAEITGQWLESIGFLQDGDDERNKEYGIRAWPLSHLENSDDDTANMIQVLVSANDQSVWLEVYAPNGDSLALIEVPGGTQERVLQLCEALGIETKSEPKAEVLANWLHARSDEIAQIAEGESLSASQACLGKAEAYREIAARAEREGWTRTR